MRIPRPRLRSAERLLESLRLRLSAAEALLGLCLLGAATGALAGAIIIAFRLLVETSQALLLPGGGHEGYEGLSWSQRLLLPTVGGVLVGAYLRFLGGREPRTGVVYVMERTVYHQGYLPLRNAVSQFVGAAIAIICGHSVGREGPSVHLGATAGSQLGQYLRLPNNTMRTLVACGTAAAIGASFNTPLAGVAFAMEVVVMEYSIAGFLPVLLAAVAATGLSQLVYGTDPAFSVPSLHLQGLSEYPHVLLTGFVIGMLAVAFNHALGFFSNCLRDHSIALRCALGGLAVGVVGVGVPEVMGIGYDTVTLALHGELDLALLCLIVAAKLVATAAVLGMGVPGGLIGPTLVVGAAAGGAMGHVGGLLAADTIAAPAFYALLGMGAMMGACLRAPLAALTAMLELTANPNVIMPGMLAIVVATLTTSEIFRTDSVFIAWLREKGLDPRRNPLMHAFSRVGIVRVMDRRLAVLPRRTQRAQLDQALAEEPRWVLITEPQADGADQPVTLVPVADLLQDLAEDDPRGELDLLALPAQRLQPAAVEIRASLREALDILRRERAEALYVVQASAPGIQRYLGVVTHRDIESQYGA